MDIPQFPIDAPELTVNVPPTLAGNGKEFEELLMNSAKRMKDRLMMKRFGTTAVPMPGGEGGRLQWQPVASRPDFDLTYMGGATANIEAKVCSQPSFSLSEKSLKDAQYEWMRDKAIFGVPCYLVIHFNRRQVGKSNNYEPAFTVSLHVHPELQLWRDYEEGTLKSISREMALAHGVRVPWTVPKGSRKPLPHFI